MYIPKNRILTNQYTRGEEYVIKTTKERYVGFYHRLFTGQIFTGKTPNDSIVLELIPNEQPQNQEISQNVLTTSNIALFLDDPDPLIDTRIWNQNNILSYLEATQQPTNDSQPRLLPSQYYPSPTPQDYQLGVFQRYFVYRINTIEFTEVDKETYENIKTKNSNWAWKFYDYFSIPWELTGNKEKTYITNRNIVLIAERRNRAPGLGKFLRENYLKFYKG